MSAPLSKGASGRGPRPTEHQLQMARIRARTTGESVAHVLSVFMGLGRHGPGAGPGATGPEAPLSGETFDAREEAGADTEDPGQLAPVIPLSRAVRRKGSSPRDQQEG